MELIYIQAVLMGNGEIICDGKTIGWKNKVGKYIYTEKRKISPSRVEIEQIKQD